MNHRLKASYMPSKRNGETTLICCAMNNNNLKRQLAEEHHALNDKRTIIPDYFVSIVFLPIFSAFNS